MAEYIEQEDAKRELCEWATNLHDPRFLIKDDAMCVLDNIPAAEVEVIHEPTESEFKRMAIQEGYEPVVHCSECMYHHDCETHFCDRLGMDCPDDSDFFCKYGARMDLEGRTMAEYIERERLLRRFNIDDMTNVNGTMILLRDARDIIANQPAADVAPVVRCKDCKHYLGLAECEFEGHFSGGTNYFCSYGERKDNGL